MDVRIEQRIADVKSLTNCRSQNASTCNKRRSPIVKIGTAVLRIQVSNQHGSDSRTTNGGDEHRRAESLQGNKEHLEGASPEQCCAMSWTKPPHSSTPSLLNPWPLGTRAFACAASVKSGRDSGAGCWSFLDRSGSQGGAMKQGAAEKPHLKCGPPETRPARRAKARPAKQAEARPDFAGNIKR